MQRQNGSRHSLLLLVFLLSSSYDFLTDLKGQKDNVDESLKDDDIKETNDKKYEQRICLQHV